MEKANKQLELVRERGEKANYASVQYIHNGKCPVLLTCSGVHETLDTQTRTLRQTDRQTHVTLIMIGTL